MLKRERESFFLLVSGDQDDVLEAELGQMIGNRGANQTAAAYDHFGRVGRLGCYYAAIVLSQRRC